jgi:hypothetical protein
VAVTRALKRLLRIRDLEEEQARLALEAAAADLRRLEQAQQGAQELNRRGRSLAGPAPGRVNFRIGWRGLKSRGLPCGWRWRWLPGSPMRPGRMRICAKTF